MTREDKKGRADSDRALLTRGPSGSGDPPAIVADRPAGSSRWGAGALPRPRHQEIPETARGRGCSIWMRPIALAALLLAGCAAPSAPAAVDKPNIVFVLADDQGWPTLGCYGNRRVPTPNLDRLAAEGVRFTDAYVEPQCTPTRASLLTGRRTARNGMWHVIGWYGYPWARVAEPPFVENLPHGSCTLAEGLRRAGYVTGIFGKWHLTNSPDGNYRGLKPEGGPHYGFDVVGAPLPETAFQTGGDRGVDVLTDQTLKFAADHRDRPFFAYLSHHMIHGKVVAPLDLVDAYRRKGAPETGLHNATYLAALDHLDRSIGHLMEGLGRLGLAERTVVMFLSDNGGVHAQYAAADFLKPRPPPVRLSVGELEFDNAPLRAGKGSMYEGGIRVPFIVHGPGVARGRVERTPVHGVDVLPTLFEMAGARAPEGQGLDGLSLVPLLAGTGRIPERSLYWYLPLYDLRWGLTPCSIVRRGDLKLIEWYGDWVDPEGNYVDGARVELYDLAKDIGETRDLAATHPQTESLRKELRDWLASIPAVVPGPNPRYDPDRFLLETKVKPGSAGR